MLVANFYPDRINITQRRERTHTQLIDRWLNKYHKEPAVVNNKNSLANLSVKKSSINLSKSSIRELKKSFSTLVFYSTPRTIFRKNKNPIYNYRASFITLTLPSKQTHSDTEIKQCLNLFLTDLRRVYGLKNYVWRSEIQKNGNIHFHLVIDQYIEQPVLKNYWLKALRHTGYLQAFQNKFINLTFSQYKAILLTKSYLEKYGSGSEERLLKSYANGKRTKWLSPPVCDVKSIFNVNQASAYVAKYMGKNSNYAISQDRASNFGKIWGRSTSLSCLKFRFPVEFDCVKELISELISSDAVYTKVYEWCTSHYFNFKKMSYSNYRFVSRLIKNVGDVYHYPYNTG